VGGCPLQFCVRQVSGVWRRDGFFSLAAQDDSKTFAEDGVQLLVLPHTADFAQPRELLGAYRAHGAEQVQREAGDCAFILFDRNAPKLVIGRDTLGTTPLVYVANEYGIAFGTRVGDLKGALPFDLAPNRRALAALLIDFSAPQNNETYFQGIASVPPGGLLIAHTESHTVHHSGGAWPRVTDLSYPHAVDRFRELFRNAVVRRLDAEWPTAIMVSGGLDSAAIACIAMQHSDVFGITYGPEDGSQADESRYTSLLEQAGLRIVRVPFFPTNDLRGMEQSVRESETPVPDQVTLTLQRAMAAARAEGARALLLGTWGDQVLSHFPPPHHAGISPLRRNKLRTLARAYGAYMTDVPEAEIFNALWRQSLRRRAPDWYLRRRRRAHRQMSVFDILASEFDPPAFENSPRSFGEAVWRNVTAPHQVQSLGGTARWANFHGLDARLPYVDTQLVEFLKSVPDEIAYHDHALKPLLRAAMRDVVPAALIKRRDKGDYTEAIARASVPIDQQLEYLGTLEEVVDFGLMSRASATRTLALLASAAEIGNQDRIMSQLMGVTAWIRIYFKTIQ
jgi:asparagine synthase (glutamine-hydrolysing)